MEKVRETIERRWVRRMTEARAASAEGRKAAHLGNMAASAELEDLAADLGIDIDNDTLMQRVTQLESETEQAAQALGEDC